MNIKLSNFKISFESKSKDLYIDDLYINVYREHDDTILHSKKIDDDLPSEYVNSGHKVTIDESSIEILYENYLLVNNIECVAIISLSVICDEMDDFRLIYHLSLNGILMLHDILTDTISSSLEHGIYATETPGIVIKDVTNGNVISKIDGFDYKRYVSVNLIKNNRIIIFTEDSFIEMSYEFDRKTSIFKVKHKTVSTFPHAYVLTIVENILFYQEENYNIGYINLLTSEQKTLKSDFGDLFTNIVDLRNGHLVAKCIYSDGKYNIHLSTHGVTINDIDSGKYHDIVKRFNHNSTVKLPALFTDKFKKQIQDSIENYLLPCLYYIIFGYMI